MRQVRIHTSTSIEMLMKNKKNKLLVQEIKNINAKYIYIKKDAFI